jgi:diaminopimelate decarboxylase
MSIFSKYLPNFKQYFAVKALPNAQIMKILAEEGMGFDCSSIMELELTITSNKNPSIFYSSNYTSVEDFQTVLSKSDCNNIIINLDDIDGLENMKLAMEIDTKHHLAMPNILCFRLNPCIGLTNSETKSNILGGIDTKFGIPDTRIVDAYKMAKMLGIKRFGIHVMTGSCILNTDYWGDLIDIVFKNINTISKELNITFEFINLGGGIGIPYKPDVKPVDIEELAKLISEKVRDNVKKYNIVVAPNIIMENGRYITGPYGWLVSKCKSIKIGYNDAKFYGLDSCMANLMRPGMYGAYHHIIVPRLEHEEETEEVNVVGSLCENNDWFAKNRKLPRGIEKEDIFVICDAGAHSHCMGFQYNGKPRSPEILLTKKLNKINAELIRVGESVSSMLLSQNSAKIMGNVLLF